MKKAKQTVTKPKKMKPIVFHANMVQAILDGKKSMTRLVVNPQPNGELSEEEKKALLEQCPYQVGEFLWVKERYTMFAVSANGKTDTHVIYAQSTQAKEQFADEKFRPPQSMPKYASRITLKVNDIWIERLQEITADDALLEGSYLDRCSCSEMQRSNKKNSTGIMASFKQTSCYLHGLEFKELWNDTVRRKQVDWNSNPYVWVISFDTVEIKKTK